MLLEEFSKLFPMLFLSFKDRKELSENILILKEEAVVRQSTSMV